MSKKFTLIKKSHPLKAYTLFYSITLGVLILSLIVASVVLGVIYMTNPSLKGALIALLIAVPVVGVLTILYLAFVGKMIYEVFFRNLYSISRYNLEVMSGSDNTVSGYVANKVKEFDELNEIVDKVSVRYMNTFISSASPSYDKIPFIFLDQANYIVTYKSFTKYIKEIISSSIHFRNAFISLTYKVDSPLSEEQLETIYANIKKSLNYESVVIVDNTENHEIIIYVPNFDSISRLKEDINELLKLSTIFIANKAEADVMLCHASVVIYPYSGADDIITDLRYANRQDKVINFYIPTRSVSISDNHLSSSTNINFISKMMEKFSALEVKTNNYEKIIPVVTKYIKNVNEYLGVDASGVIFYNEIDNVFTSTVSLGDKNPFKLNETVENSIIELIDKIKDEDNSYYFSSRKHVNSEFGRYLDLYGVSSGHFYVVKNNGKLLGLVYFLKEEQLVLDSYLRESLTVISNITASIIKETEDKRFLHETDERFNDVLRISGLDMYSIEKETHKIRFVSESLKDKFSNASVGALCHKVFFGKDEPCENCPLVSGRKMVEELLGEKYEISSLVNSAHHREAQLLFTPTSKDYVSRDRFDKDLLINSYYSFLQHMQNNLYAKAKGYILFLTIDNMDEMLSAYSNEEMMFILRSFTKKIRHLQDHAFNVYSYRNDILAIIIPEIGKNDIIELCEKIYDFSKVDYVGNENQVKLALTYTATSYSTDYTQVQDLVRFIETKELSYKHIKGADLIIMPDTHYERPASRNDFLLSIINDSFSNKTFNVKLQPFIRKYDRRIIGAELLLRLKDEYRNIDIRPDELIEVAANNGKISVITDALIEYIGKLNMDYGVKWFKRFGLTRLAINTNNSYFLDEEFVDKLVASTVKYQMPKEFLSFEIREQDIHENYEQYSSIAKKVSKNNICLVCDNYTGEYVPVEKLKELGFKGIKIDRSITFQMIDDPTRLASIRSILQLAASNELGSTVVGAETKEQFNLLKDENKDYDIQGYLFYKPLDEDQFLRELQKNR